MIAFVIPSRGRPENVRRLLTEGAQVWPGGGEIIAFVAVDRDDPRLPEYRNLRHLADVLVSVTGRSARSSSHASNVNRAAAYAAAQGADTLIKLDDDHMPRTRRWAGKLAEAAGPWGMAWPNDGHPTQHLPTVCAMGRNLYRALGWMLPPHRMQHLFTDDYWLALGTGLNVAGYQHEIVVEHLHPHLGKAPGDDGYEHVNSQLRWQRDGKAWQDYRKRGNLARDVRRVREAMGTDE